MLANDIIPVGDDTLSMAVRSRLQMELGLTHQVVKATAVDGVVTLRGKLESGAERQAAKAIAESIRGVRKVINDISTAYSLAVRRRGA